MRETRWSTEWVWVAALPAAALTLAAVLWLAEPLSGPLEPPGELRFFESLQPFVRPEPVEQARYLLAVLGALAFAAILSAPALGRRARTLTTGERAGNESPVVIRATAIAVQLAALAFAAVAVVKQADAPKPLTSRLDSAIFEPWHWAAAMVLTAAVAALALGPLRSRASSLLDRAGGLLSAHRWIGPGLAFTITILWLLPAFYTAENVGGADPLLLAHLPLLHDEYAAAVNGLTPFVDYTAIYNFVLPMLAHPLLELWGYGVTGFSALMVGLVLASLLAVYALFSNAFTRREAAIGLYVPFLAITLYPLAEAGGEIIFAGNAYGNLPGRYFGPLLAGWLAVRYLRRGAPAPVLVFAVAALAALNNSDMGLAAFAAVAAALWLGTAGRRAAGKRFRELAAAAAAGAAVAVAFVAVLTLVRAGELPDLSELFYFPRIFGREGYALSPMPDLGLHLVLYLTFAGAVATAALRSAAAAEGAPADSRAPTSGAGPGAAAARAGGDQELAERARAALTGALGFAGVFGLLAGVYYVGESEPTRIVALFLPWGIAIALLGYLAIGALGRERERGPGATTLAPALAVLVALSLSAVVTVRFPEPWVQVERITRDGPEFYAREPTVEFVRRHTRPDQPVAILNRLGHVIAEEAGVNDTFPFDHPGNIKTYDQMERVIDQLRDAGGEVLFVTAFAAPQVFEHLRGAGYEVAATGGEDVENLTVWRERGGGGSER